MNYMFSNCSSLKSLDLSNFNTTKLTSAFAMFKGCSSLTELNISNFNIKNVIYIKSMFSGCSNKIKKRIRAQFKDIKEEAFNN